MPIVDFLMAAFSLLLMVTVATGIARLFLARGDRSVLNWALLIIIYGLFGYYIAVFLLPEAFLANLRLSFTVSQLLLLLLNGASFWLVSRVNNSFRYTGSGDKIYVGIIAAL
mgnify:CR=1 FL=1